MGSCLTNLCRRLTRTPGPRIHADTEARGTRTLLCPLCGESLGAATRFEEHLVQCNRLHSATEPQESNIQIPYKTPCKDEPYNTKIAWLRSALEAVRVPWIKDHKNLIVSRSQLLQASLEQLLHFTPHDMHKEFHVKFEGELAQDAGGLTKEWLCTLTKLVLSQAEGMFVLSQADNVSYSINPDWKPDLLPLYNFAGMAFAKALFEGIPIPCFLNRILFKHLVGESISLADLQFFDSSLHSSMIFMQDNDITSVLFEKFCVGQEELKPGGLGIAVTNDNKAEYISLRINYEVYLKVKPPTDAFLEGFYKVVPKELLVCLTFDELELALSGIPFIDVTDWEDNTRYRGLFHSSQQVIRWFWEILSTLTQEQLSNLLQFSTGTSRLPVEGFRSLRTLRGDTAKFTIESLDLGFLYPRAHTCFNRLDLPLYTSMEDLKNSLIYVIENHNAGFGME